MSVANTSIPEGVTAQQHVDNNDNDVVRQLANFQTGGDRNMDATTTSGINTNDSIIDEDIEGDNGREGDDTRLNSYQEIDGKLWKQGGVNNRGGAELNDNSKAHNGPYVPTLGSVHDVEENAGEGEIYTLEKKWRV